MTTFAEWREYGENLSRFASTREKAERPLDRVVIQNKSGVQKVVAGDFGKTLIVTIGPTDQPDGRTIVASRLFLTTLKTLKGKGSASLLVTDSGATITTSFGSEIEMDNIDGFFKFLTPTPYKKGSGRLVTFDAGFLPAASKYLMATADYQPFNQVLAVSKNHKMMLRSSDNYIESTVGPLDADADFTIHFPDHLFPSLRGLEAAGGIWLPEHAGTQAHQVQLFAGAYRVVSVVLPNYGKFPAVAEYPYTVRVHGDKKLLVDTFKSFAGRHQYHRVVMEAGGGKFTIRSGDEGAARLDIENEGQGTLPVNATFMAKTLNTVEGKSATIEYADSPSLVRVTGDTNHWPIKVSPMK